jgi:hypothetical protein
MDRLENNLEQAAAKSWNVRPAAERRVRPMCLCSALPPLPPSTDPPRRSLHTMLELFVSVAVVSVCLWEEEEEEGVCVGLSQRRALHMHSRTHFCPSTTSQRAALIIVQRPDAHSFVIGPAVINTHTPDHTLFRHLK